MDLVYYTGGMILGLASLALQGVAVWLTVEGIYWIYCKLNGKEY